MKKTFFLFPVLLLWWHGSFGQKAEIAFRIPEKDLIPEGITYDPSSKSFFVSSIYKRKIVRIDEQGKVSDFVSSAQDDIGQVLGLKVVDGKLWACSNLPDDASHRISMVYQFDIATGKLVKKWIFQFGGEAHLFNDLAVTADGNAFISDSDFGAVYQVNQSLEKPELWKKDDQLRDINGIALLNDGALVVNASIGFFKIDQQTKRISSISFEGYYPLGIDGLSLYKQSLIGIQNVVFPRSINQYYLNDSFTQIEKANVLVAAQPQFDVPTTGTIAGDWYFFVANSQLTNFEKGKIKDLSKLKEVLIMKVKLN